MGLQQIQTSVVVCMLDTTPMHRRIAKEIQSRIENGTYGVGELLPTEIELAEELGVSRGTIREALRHVTELGLVERVRKRGTTVLRNRPLVHYQQFLRSIDELIHYASDTTLHIKSIQEIGPNHEMLPAHVSKRVDGWLCVEGWRTAANSNQPISWTQLFINNRYDRIKTRLANANSAVFSIIENEFGIMVSDVDQTISAVPIEGDAAKELAVPDGTAGLRVDRVMTADRDIVEYTVNIHPGSAQTYSMRFARKAAG